MQIKRLTKGEKKKRIIQRCRSHSNDLVPKMNELENPKKKKKKKRERTK